MGDTNIVFCRLMLSTLVEEFKAEFPHVRTQLDGYTQHTGFRNHWEFHGISNGPADKFYWHGHADNAYDARYKGWSAWREDQLKRIGMEYQSPPAGAYYITLAPGWSLMGTSHKIIENTRGMARRRLADVVKCECKTCKANLERKK